MCKRKEIHVDDLADGVALVTGSASGIGHAATLALAREGAAVLCFDLLDCGAVAAEIEALGGRALACRGSIADEGDVAEAVALCEAELGPLGVVVNCAGVGEFGSLEETGVDRMRQVLEVNLLGPMLVLKHALAPMRERGAGSAVLIGSVAGKNGGIRSGPAYGASKGGVHALVKWAAHAYADAGVRVNAVAPGPVPTGMTEGQNYTAAGIPLARLGEPEDIAEAIVFLASDASSWVTGQTLNVNGGVLME